MDFKKKTGVPREDQDKLRTMVIQVQAGVVTDVTNIPPEHD